MNPAFRRALITAVSILMITAAAPPRAVAHPLGNFTVNYHTGLALHPDRVDATVIVDRAEIATVQERPRIDLDRNGTTTPDEVRVYATATCGTLGLQLHTAVAGFPCAGTGGRRTSCGNAAKPD